MNDFFSTLVQRVLGSAPVVRPMIPSMFTWEAAANESLSIGNSWREDQAESMSKARRPETGDVRPEPTVNHEQSLIEQSKPDFHQAGEKSLQISPQGNSSRSFAQKNLYMNSIASDKLPPSTLMSEQIEENTPVKGIKRAQSDLLSFMQEEVPSLVNSEKGPAFDNGLEKTRPLSHYRIRQSEPIAESQRTIASEQHISPTIRVHIGRIEVRAIMPSAPPKPRISASQKNPSLTLDDYLKQRDGGKR